MVDLTSFAANRNWMAQTRRQERLRDRVRAHMATVTWYTVSSSSRFRNLSLDLTKSFPTTGGEGRIFNKKTSDPGIIFFRICFPNGMFSYLMLKVETPMITNPMTGSFPSPPPLLSATWSWTRWPACHVSHHVARSHHVSYHVSGWGLHCADWTCWYGWCPPEAAWSRILEIFVWS